MSLVIGLDFDGTCVTHSFPNLGNDIGAVPVLKDLVAAGHKLILFTMRCDDQKDQDVNGYKIYGGNFLTQAVNWFKDNDIELYGVQTNPTQGSWTTSPKPHCHIFIDDCGIFMPLIYDPLISKRAFVCWKSIRKELESRGVI